MPASATLSSRITIQQVLLLIPWKPETAETAPAVQEPTPPPPPPPPLPQKVIIPAGTQFTVRLNDPLDSERNQVGDTFHGSLSAPIVINGETAIPSGADVVGRVAEVKSAGRFAGNADAGTDFGLDERQDLQHPNQSVVTCG